MVNTNPTDFSNFDFARDFLRRMLPNNQVVALAAILLCVSLLIYLLSGVLTPVFAAIILAYLLDGLVVKIERLGAPHFAAVLVVFSGFMTVLGFILLVLIPIVTDQLAQFINRLPVMVASTQQAILRFPEKHPELISQARVKQILYLLQENVLQYGQELITLSAQSFANLLAAVIYLFLVPFMIFFFLKDKHLLLKWCARFLPSERSLTLSVWEEVDKQIANYVRGKFLEIFILWAASYSCFYLLDLNYAMLLAVLMGISVLIPYVGATLVTIPVLAVAYLQWGTGDSGQFNYVLLAYCIIQALDGVVLVPLLFSEAVNLHPVAIIIATLFFGGFWGFWGVFFAIPLATLVKAVLSAWPRIEAG